MLRKGFSLLPLSQDIGKEHYISITDYISAQIFTQAKLYKFVYILGA